MLSFKKIDLVTSLLERFVSLGAGGHFDCNMSRIANYLRPTVHWKCTGFVTSHTSVSNIHSLYYLYIYIYMILGA